MSRSPVGTAQRGRSEAGSDDDWPALSVSFGSLSRSPRQKDGGRSSAEPYYLSNYREADGRKAVRKKVGCLGKKVRRVSNGHGRVQQHRAPSGYAASAAAKAAIHVCNAPRSVGLTTDRGLR